MKIGIVVSTNEPELARNAFTYGVRAIENKHDVNAFLLGKGVECEEIVNPTFGVKRMMKEFCRQRWQDSCLPVALASG